MYYLCICQQPGNFDIFKGHGPASSRWAYELSYSWGITQVGDKAQRGEGQKFENTISLFCC